tara:strand:- start:1415 stop:2620 length:1206 start_codon:yes stop_codon:yes gene_type:complete
MPLYKFGPKDILKNRIKTYPNNTFFIHSASVYYNNRNNISGAFVDNVTHVPSGFVSLYELNIDRDFSKHTYDPDTNAGVKAKIFPFITKDSSLNSFATVSDNNFNQFLYGDIITGSYPLSSSIVRETFDASTNPTGSHLLALKNTLNYYQTTSKHYAYSSSGNWDKSQQELTLISIPSIFYGSSIRKNSIKLDFYISGTLVASCEDLYRNGELIQTSGTAHAQANGSGSVAGVALYNEGFILLTGSWNLTEVTHDFGAVGFGKWKDFGAGANDGLSATDLTPSASFSLSFQGTNYINTLTMLCDAPFGDLTYSPNPTYATAPTGIGATGSTEGYLQEPNIPIKNTISSSFHNYEEDFKPQTFISKIGIYDERRNLIAVANLAKPVKKLEDRDYTFRLKLDI